MTKDMWETLGIEETKDRETILNAYRNKVVTVNPDGSSGWSRRPCQ